MNCSGRHATDPTSERCAGDVGNSCLWKTQGSCLGNCPLWILVLPDQSPASARGGSFLF